MRRLYVFAPLLVLAGLAMVLSGCGGGGGGTPPPSGDVVEITSDITTTTTWTGDKIYVIKKWDFYVSATLTINAGAIIKFHPDGPGLTLGTNGTINANGNSTSPIVFTSYKDDAHGGDTNGDGNGTAPGMGDWDNISTNSQQGSTFNYCEFYYGGGGGYDSTLQLYGSRANVTNCKFAYNNGLDDGVLDASDALANTVITNNLFYANVKPMSINSTFNLNDTNVFHSGSQYNTYNGIFLYYPDDIATARTWSETEVAFVIDDNDWWIEDTGSLTLGNNVVLKFMPDGCIVYHTNIIQGTGVYFTSYKDDTLKGDTNGDGSASSPGDYDWVGIYNNTTSLYETWSNITYDSH